MYNQFRYIFTLPINADRLGNARDTDENQKEASTLLIPDWSLNKMSIVFCYFYFYDDHHPDNRKTGCAQQCTTCNVPNHFKNTTLAQAIKSNSTKTRFMQFCNRIIVQ